MQSNFALGRKIYNERCYFCHGYSGNARTLASSYLSPPPRDFTSAEVRGLSRERMINAVKFGIAGSAMQGFAGRLAESEIIAVVDFVRRAFIENRLENTKYHTPENGWPDHERYKAAFPYVTGDLMPDMPLESLTPEQLQGRKLFLSACITCHDRGRAMDERDAWDPRAVSFPRGAYSHQDPVTDATTGATPYAKHDRRPRLAGLTAQQKLGESLFQQNCAFCHAADGTARNWIGSFLQPRPRDLTDPAVMQRLGHEGLKQVIRKGVPGTAMSAWDTVLTETQIEAVAAYVVVAFSSVTEKDSKLHSGQNSPGTR